MIVATHTPTLYQYAACPYCCKVRAVLDYKQVDYDIVEVHPLNKKEIEFSSYKKVPIFIDRMGQQIQESTNIMRAIDSTYSEYPVFERDEKRSLIEQEWLNWVDEVFVRALPPVIYGKMSDAVGAFDYITRVGKFSWLQQRVVKYSGAVVMRMVARRSARAQGIQNPVEHLRQCVLQWQQALMLTSPGAPFLGGTTPNAADLAVAGVIKSVETLSAFELIKENETVHHWYMIVRKRLIS